MLYQKENKRWERRWGRRCEQRELHLCRPVQSGVQMPRQKRRVPHRSAAPIRTSLPPEETNAPANAASMMTKGSLELVSPKRS